MGYNRNFITGFRKTAEPLQVTKKIKKKLEWSTEYKSAVTKLNKKLLEASVSEYPNDMFPYTLTSDASLTGSVAVLTQKQ